ncbi:hypothetical protein LUZ60_000753 [Juncus effusus]|nr:hypothetical protein LUZ60_000753 [Juncus effusus]
MGRAPCCDKTTVKRGPWSPEEDATLKAYIEEHGTGGNWIALPQKIGIKRCGKSCRLRWLNYLRPNIKHGGFSEAEDDVICRLYISIGSRWSIIAAQLPGRTDNDIKNYWNTRLKKKLLGKRPGHLSRRSSANSNTITQSNSNRPATCHNPTPSETLSRSALERMQLHMQLQGLYNPFANYYNLNPPLHPNPNILQNNSNFPTQGLEYHEVLNTSMEGSLDSTNNLLGFPSPSLSLTDGAGTENSGSGFSSPVTGLQPELYELMYGKTGPCDIGTQNELLMPQLSGTTLKGLNEEENLSWWSSNGFDEKSSFAWDVGSSFQPESMLQEYYGLLGNEI